MLPKQVASASCCALNPVGPKADLVLKQEDGVHTVVREAYTARVKGQASAWGSGDREVSTAQKHGYSQQDLEHAGEGNLGEGCGNPLGFANIQAGHVVVDLGSGAGFDCLLAGKAVGEQGRVIGVDMTPDMITKARKIVKEKAIKNVSFRLGEIEYLPVGDGVADRVISNCVINLSPDKTQVYREALRVLKPGGMLAIADVVAMQDIPEHLQTAESLACWVSGAAKPEAVEEILRAVGFVDIKVDQKAESREVIKNWMPGSGAEDYVVSANIQATKPGASTEAVAEPSLPIDTRQSVQPAEGRYFVGPGLEFKDAAPAPTTAPMATAPVKEGAWKKQDWNTTVPLTPAKEGAWNKSYNATVPTISKIVAEEEEECVTW